MIHVRVPAPLRDEIQEFARKHGRSMSAEIVLRLSQKPEEVLESEAESFLREEAADLEVQIPGIKWELNQAHKRLGEMFAMLVETRIPVADDKIALLQSQTRFYRARLEEAESRLRRIRRIIK